jgi:DNA-binding response OmpR family regulator
MKFPELVVDWKRFTIVRDGEETQLSRYEAEILRMLIEHRGEVVSRQDGGLLRKVWGLRAPADHAHGRQPHRNRLRKKVIDSATSRTRTCTSPN